ncbi:Tim44 domain-containing protein [Lichenicoccus sp.]|uniref:Tim44 domain-containing protein n=1 Tax=Lichenicoccus sp. TaxID=2781899 RepID=UPI003D14FACB
MNASHTLSRLIAAVLLLGGLALAPPAADARAGHGFSFGSRGSRTFSMPAPTRSAPYGAAPLSRSMTQPAPYANRFGANRLGGGVMGRRSHPLAAGLLGGFLGAGLAGMLFGHGFFGGGLGFGHLLGILIQLALIVFAVRWLMRRFANGSARSMAGAGPGYAQPTARMPSGAGYAANAPPLAISQADYQQFEQSLQAVQAAWTRADVGALQSLATPEMVSYFGEQLQDQSRRGLRNAVSDVHLDRGDLSEAWSEGGADYATVAMRYSMIDVTRDAGGRVVDGSLAERVSIAEFWTFVRYTGGRWLLSAIQQGR